MDFQFGVFVFSLFGLALFIVSVFGRRRPRLNQYFFVFLFTVIPLGKAVAIPLVLMFVSGLLKGRASCGHYGNGPTNSSMNQKIKWDANARVDPSDPRHIIYDDNNAF